MTQRNTCLLYSIAVKFLVPKFRELLYFLQPIPM